MRNIKNEQEIEQGYFRSLAIVAATFVVANLVLFIGFTTSTHAQALDSTVSVMHLAKMLAAPDMTPNLSLSSSHLMVFGAMGTGLLVMAAGLVAMTKNLVRDFSEPESARY